MTAAATGDDNVVMVPMVRGWSPLLAPSNEIDAPSSEAWILNGDRALTWSATAPEGNRIVKGEWWDEDYSGPPLVSMDDEAMVAFGLISVTVSPSISPGVRWKPPSPAAARSNGKNRPQFVFILSPGMIDKAPHNWVAAVIPMIPNRGCHRQGRCPCDAACLLCFGTRGRGNRWAHSRPCVDSHPHYRRDHPCCRLCRACRYRCGERISPHSQRHHSEGAGAERRVILSSYIAEYALLGGITALVAMVIGVACWALMTGFLNSNFTFLPGGAASHSRRHDSNGFAGHDRCHPQSVTQTRACVAA